MIQLVNATANRIPLPDNSVHCVVTSPPYWGLRDYGLPPRVWGGEVGCEHVWGDKIPSRAQGGQSDFSTSGLLRDGRPEDGRIKTLTENAKAIRKESPQSAGQFCQRCGAWRGCLGLEPTPEMYIEHMVEVFGEIKRVLRDDGTVWLNLGDSYASSSGTGHGGWDGNNKNADGSPRQNRQSGDKWLKSSTAVSGLKPKDLCGIPWHVAFALQADGWWLRSDIIWAKTNPMPESVTDRPTKSHEYLFLLAKRVKYYYDADAVRENGSTNSHGGGSNWANYVERATGQRCGWHNAVAKPAGASGRNRRSVWTISTKPFSGAHFATYPPALVEPCIKAGTSERGVCPECGGPWERVVEKKRPPLRKTQTAGPIGNHGLLGGHRFDEPIKVTTTGWRPTCPHYPETHLWQEYPRQEKDESDEDYTQRMEPICLERQRLLALWEPMEAIPATVLDPFVGSGTTLLVARQLGRNGIGLDLSFDYLFQQARKRLELDKLASWGETNVVPDDDLPLFQGML